ncbi:MAG: hypothetical protein KF796_08435 [Ramlibacter sp.]|nr:hypothetical protein [Ramlibacter sp.]
MSIMTLREFDLLTIPAIHQTIGPVIDSLLQPQGFVSFKPLQWVRSDNAPIRQLFEYRQLKGGALAPAWGYSLDFVPHFSGREMKWHRTEKSALLDAFVDGQCHRDLLLTCMYGVPGLLENLQHRVAAAVQMARQFWATGDTPHRVYSIVEALRSEPGSSYFVQLPIANAFCLALSGREAEGRAELEGIIQDRCRYPSTELSEKTIAKVWLAFRDASSTITGERTP